jgi:hypothetical protein
MVPNGSLCECRILPVFIYFLFDYDKMIVLQAGLWVAGYILAFPVFISCKLYSYSSQLKQKSRTADGLSLGFLLDDYKTTFPLIMWYA